MKDVRGLLASKHANPATTRMALAKHVEEIVLLPEGEGREIKYRGNWKLLGVRVVPRGRVELPTPAFSGPRSTGELPRHTYNTRFYGKAAALERKNRAFEIPTDREPQRQRSKPKRDPLASSRRSSQDDDPGRIVTSSNRRIRASSPSFSAFPAALTRRPDPRCRPFPSGQSVEPRGRNQSAAAAEGWK
jgi:hypothetical protein